MNENCQKIEPLLASYALEALSQDEKIAVETHIETCESCQLALEDYLAVSEGFMGAVPPVQPPARVRARLLAEIHPEQKPRNRLGDWWGNLPRLTTAAGFLTVLILAVLNISLLRNSNQILSSYKNLVQQNQAYQTGFALLADPDSQVLVLDEQDISGTLVYAPDGQFAFLNVQGLAELPEGQVYQIWLIEADETRISGGLFNALDETGYASFIINSPSPLDSFVGIGVTIEPEGGSPGPTGPRIFGLEL